MDSIGKIELLINALYSIYSLEHPGFPEVLNAPRQVTFSCWLPMNIYTDWQHADGVKDVDEQVFVHTGYQSICIA